MRKRWKWITVVVVLVVLLLVAFFEPNRILRGYLAWEAFFDYRPTSYWREILLAESTNQRLSNATRELFGKTEVALPVLFECAHDQDADVRMVAVDLIGDHSLFGDQGVTPVLSALEEALADEAPQVRFEAARSLRYKGQLARRSFPALLPLRKDPDPQVSHQADRALWAIDEPAAIIEGGWKQFTSPDFNFTVLMPGEPNQEHKTGRLDRFVFTSQHLRTLLTITVSTGHTEIEALSNPDKKLTLAREWVLANWQGKLVKDGEVTVNDLKGREIVVAVEIEPNQWWHMRSRLYWVEPRLYHAIAMYEPDLLNENAVDYFLDSFRLSTPLER